MDLFESNEDKTCAWCGGALGLKRYKTETGSTKRFCTIPHLQAWLAAKERQRVAQQQRQTFAVVMGGKA